MNKIDELKKSIEELSVYDLNTYSAIELYYKIANKLNEVITEFSDYENIINEVVIKQNEEIQFLLNEGLENEVINKINKIINDGTIENIINTNIFNDLKLQIKDNENFVNVKKFGVVGDGVTDDTVAMQKAFNYGGNLYLPDTYLLNGELKVKSNTHLLGVAGKTMFKKSQAKYIRESDSSERWTIHLAVGSYGFKNAVENVTIENIILDGNSGRTTTNAYDDDSYGNAQIGAKLLECVNANNIKIKNVICQNNNYAGCMLVSCTDVLVDNFKSLNCDVGISVLKDEKTDTIMKNLTFNNIYIDGHDYSEGFSLYAKDKIYNVTLNNITILNKEKGTGLLIGTEYSGDYGVINSKISNVRINGSAVGMSISQNGNNNQVNNVYIENCTRGMLISQTSHDNQLTNINIKDIKNHGLFIGSEAYNNILSNINISNCNTNALSDYNQSYIIINGNKNICDNISITDISSSKQFGLVVSGNENKFSFKNVIKDTEKFQFHAVGSNNIINVNATKFHKCSDINANYVTCITNQFTTTFNDVYTKTINSNNISLSDTIFNKYVLNLASAISLMLTNITLFEQYKRIYVTIKVTKSNGSITLSNDGNIVWKSNDTLNNGDVIHCELICNGNKWIEMNRY